MQSEQIDQLATALAAAQSELLPAIKDSTNPHLRNRYADLGSCWEAIKACLPRHGLSVVQGGYTRGGRDFVRTTLLHASGQWISGITPIFLKSLNKEGRMQYPAGMNTMQALGSAISYARRYGLAAICGLTAEDDDGQGSGTPPPRREPERPAPAPARPANGPKPAGDILDRLTRRYLDKREISESAATSAKFELWNHLATKAVADGKLFQESLWDVDGTRSNSLVVKALHGLCGEHDGWLTAEVKSYLDTKLQTQEAPQ